MKPTGAVVAANDRNCRNCGAPPRPFDRACGYCGTANPAVADWPPQYAVRGAEPGEALEVIRLLSATGYAVIPNDVVIEMLRTPTPGERMLV